MYIVPIYIWDLTVIEIQLDNKNKIDRFYYLAVRKTGTFVNRVWIDTRLYIFILFFWPRFILNHMTEEKKNIYKGKTLTTPNIKGVNEPSIPKFNLKVDIHLNMHIEKINPIKYDNVVNIWIEFAWKKILCYSGMKVMPSIYINHQQEWKKGVPVERRWHIT